MSVLAEIPSGRQLIGFAEVEGEPSGLRGVDPSRNEPLDGSFTLATADQVDEASTLAASAAPAFAAISPRERAAFLEAIAEELRADREAIIGRAHAETALPLSRLEGELGRTAGQMTLFAGVLRKGDFLRVAIDTPDATRTPLPKPAMATMQVPIGPIAVFAASNFPLAYSAAGGDTASALAAGCPVVVRAHPAHPGTAELAGRAILRAARRSGMPEGVFSLLTGPGNALGAALVEHPAICGVGFTGSRKGGLALAALAAGRPVPIPFFAEMSSVNPVFLFPAALAERGPAIAEGLVASVLLGVGQFCTSPGLVLGIGGPAWDAFTAAAAAAMQKAGAATMLHAGIAAAYAENTSALRSLPGVDLLARGTAGDTGQAQPMLCHTTAAAFLAEPRMSDEVFGPATLLIRCETAAQMLDLAMHLEGQLTASLHMEPADYALAREFIALLSARAGRLVANSFPTGLEVGHATVHGGPYPSTTDSRFTAVGARALERWLRPVCFQSFPDTLLPEALQAANPRSVPRLVDGALSSR